MFALVAMSARKATLHRKTGETQIEITLNLDGRGRAQINTGVGFLDHMLNALARHARFDLTVRASGDLHVDEHHTVEDVGIVLGDTLNQALGNRKGIKRYGHAVTPMDDALSAVTIDLSNRPYLVFNVPVVVSSGSIFNSVVAKEFFRALTNRGGLNLHINVSYGDNEHHILESIYKALGRALDQAASFDDRIVDVRSSKGSL